jgi:hypothetical protein
MPSAELSTITTFASGTDGQDPCDNFDNPKHDFDSCVRDAVPKPVLFLRQADDPDEVNVHDVQQLRVGDCYLMAALARSALGERSCSLR